MALRQSTIRVLLFDGVIAGLVAACVSYPEGKIACSKRSECPDDWYCEIKRSDDDQRYCFSKTQGVERGLGVEDGSGGSSAGTSSAGGEPGRGGGGSSSRAGSGGGDSAAAGSGGDSSAAGSGGGDSAAAGSGGRATAAGSNGGGSAADSGGSDARANDEFRVTDTSPAQGEGAVADLNGAIVVHFSEPVNEQSVTDLTYKITTDEAAPDTVVQPSPFEPSFEDGGKTLKLRPKQAWRLSTRYEVNLRSSILSQSRKALVEARWQFTTRAGQWSDEIVITNEQDARVAKFMVAASPSGESALTWHSFRMGPFHRLVTKRRSVAGKWTPIDEYESGGMFGTPMVQIAFTDYDQLVYGRQTENPNESWMLKCHADSGETVPLSVTGVESAIGVRLQGISARRGDVYVLQGQPWAGVLTSCGGEGMARLWTVPIPSGAVLGDIASPWFGKAVWTQTASSNADAGPNKSAVWGVSSAEPCSDSARRGCPRQLSAADEDVDVVTIAGDAVLWVQGEATQRYLYTRAFPDDEEPGAETYVYGPTEIIDSLTAVSRGEEVVVAWLDTSFQATKIMAATLKDGNWSTMQLSKSSTIEGGLTAPMLATDRTGNALVMWTEAIDDAGARDVHVVPYGFSSGWHPDRDQILSTRNHAADPRVSVAMDEQGRAYAAWVDANTLWFGTYQ